MFCVNHHAYMQMFLRDYCLRPSCYECAAKKVKMSDLTIADFWGINDVAPDMNDGISLMRDVSLMSRLQLRAICLMLRVPAFWTSSLAAW